MEYFQNSDVDFCGNMETYLHDLAPVGSCQIGGLYSSTVCTGQQDDQILEIEQLPHQYEVSPEYCWEICESKRPLD